MIIPRLAAVGVAAALVLAACGSDDEAATSGTAPAPVDSGGPGGTAPTIPADVPDDFLPGIGPIAVIGDALAELPQQAAQEDPAVGEPAPVILAETVDGDAIRIDAAEDGPTWLVFLAHWCPHCNDEIPVINDLRDDGSIPDDVNVIGVATASNPGRPNWPPAQWLDDLDWTYPAILDGVDVDAGTYVAADGFGLTAFPFSVLVDGDGEVVERWAGERPAAEIAAAVQSIAP